MATVTFPFTDISGFSMEPKDAEVIFTLNQANIGMSEGTLFADMNSYSVKPDSNDLCTVGLVPTTNMAIPAWYDVSIIWNQGGQTLRGSLNIRIRVPPEGGKLKDLIDTSGGGGGNPFGRIVWVSQTPPVNPYPFMLWLQQEPGANPDPFDPLNTSLLKEWRP